MNLHFSAAEEEFRTQVADWMARHLRGKFASLKGRGGPGDEHAFPRERKLWEKQLAKGGWTCVGWPQEHGGRGLDLNRQMIFHEEYARAGAPGRMGHIGETLAGPTIISFGAEEQQRRFLPGIVAGSEFWCQGYSEPNAGSDLANISTRAEQDGDSGEWVIHGQKLWTSLAHEADWCFMLCRTQPGSSGRTGLSCLLVPMEQEGVQVRPIEQLTGTSEFNEVFFDGARTAANNLLGEAGQGWKVAMGTLAFERGVSTLGQQMQFHNELQEIIAIARRNGAGRNPALRRRIADAWIGHRIMRYHALRVLSADSSSSSLSRAAMVSKLHWANWHREMGKLAMDVMGEDGEILEDFPYLLKRLQAIFLFSRADTIYAGSNQIQRNIISERALGMPREGSGQ